MFVDELPAKKVGCLIPGAIVANPPYEFYRLAPAGLMLVMVGCGLEEFSAKDVERIFKPLDSMLDQIMAHDVSFINQVGIPLPLLVGVEAHDALIAHIAEYTGRPAVSQLINVIESLKHLKIKRVVAVNKWTEKMNATLEEFLAREGISLLGTHTKPMTVKEFTRLPTKDSAELAYDLACQAAKMHPDADAIFIGGGSWLSQPVCEQVEKETGLTTICNIGAMIWNLSRLCGLWKPIPNHGRLLASGA
jgi:maleate cis-trans isomerase